MADASQYRDSAHNFKPDSTKALSPKARAIFDRARALGAMPPHESDFFSIEEVADRMAAEAAWQRALKPSDPRHASMLEIVSVDGADWLCIYWGGYEYAYELSRIRRPEDLLWLVVHTGKKQWKHSSPERIARLIEKVSHRKGWKPFARVPHENECPPAHHDPQAEREKLTPAIRYAVIRRDGHRCRCCGGSVSTGAVLHVDHIIPVSKGGLTVKENLQALCSACNQGKAAS